jgi:hypothetical protein
MLYFSIAYHSQGGLNVHLFKVESSKLEYEKVYQLLNHTKNVLFESVINVPLNELNISVSA